MIPGLLLKTLTIFASGDEAIDKNDLIHKIFPDTPWDVVIQISSFVILLLIVFFVAYKPVKKLLKQRREYVDGMIRDAEENQRVARKAAETKDQIIEDGKVEAARIVAEAKAQASAEASAIVSEAKAEASRRRAQADKEIEEAKEASLLEVKDSIVDVAIAASSQVLEREVSKEDHEKFIKDFVDGIRDEGEGGK